MALTAASAKPLECSPGAKMGTWKSLRVQGFMIDPEAIGGLKEIKLGCHDGNLGELELEEQA